VANPITRQTAKIELTIPGELFEQLCRIAEASGLCDAAEAAMVGLAEWTAGRQADLDNRNPAEKYFVNEALDELFERRK
jgi:hypothetical protein